MLGSISHHWVIWTPLRRIILAVKEHSAHRVIAERTLHLDNGSRRNWLRPNIDRFVCAVADDVQTLRPISGNLFSLPIGNRLLVELSMYTIAAYRQMRREGIESGCGRGVTANVGWRV